jgi:uncharacterized protein YndB with AHSA1/START domain
MTDTTSAIADSDLFLSREFNAPPALLWEYWTVPERLAAWFGPEEFTVPLDSVDLDLHVGGAWSLAMASADDQRYPIRGRITELIDLELIVVVMDADAGDEVLEALTMVARFHDEGERTLITMHQGPFTDKQREDSVAGWKSSFTKLDRLLSA